MQNHARLVQTFRDSSDGFDTRCTSSIMLLHLFALSACKIQNWCRKLNGQHILIYHERERFLHFPSSLVELFLNAQRHMSAFKEINDAFMGKMNRLFRNALYYKRLLISGVRRKKISGGSRLWPEGYGRSHPPHPRTPENLRKFSNKNFLRKLQKMHYLSIFFKRNLTNHALTFRGFGRKTQIPGKF